MSFKHNLISHGGSYWTEVMNEWIHAARLVRLKPSAQPWEQKLSQTFPSATVSASQTSWTSNQPTWRIWRRWSRRPSFTPITVTCLCTAAAKGPCASVTWGRRRCATNTPNVSPAAATRRVSAVYFGSEWNDSQLRIICCIQIKANMNYLGIFSFSSRKSTGRDSLTVLNPSHWVIIIS